MMASDEEFLFIKVTTDIQIFILGFIYVKEQKEIDAVILRLCNISSTVRDRFPDLPVFMGGNFNSR